MAHVTQREASRAGGSGDKREVVVILGAAGFDYHVFNMLFRDHPDCYRVAGFSVACEQNLGTAGEGGDGGAGDAGGGGGDNNKGKPRAAFRTYPAELAGPAYPHGIPSFAESELAAFVAQHEVDTAVFAYSDVSHERVMNVASVALAAGADFRVVAPQRVQLRGNKPVIAVTATRTGVGKSSVSRALLRWFKARGYRAVAVREPMPYGELSRQRCMRFASYEDLAEHRCTVEEREEYEGYVEQGLVIYSGVDYAEVLAAAEAESDVIIWDGGNNEVAFYAPDRLLVCADPLRPGHETSYHPGEVNARMADVFVITKTHEASSHDVLALKHSLARLSPSAPFVYVASETRLSGTPGELCEEELRGKRAVVVEDGPTTTHGGMRLGAGFVFAQHVGMAIVDPRGGAVGCIKRTFEQFAHLQFVVPAMGYSEAQMGDLVATLNAVSADVIVNGSPIDLARLIGPDRLNKPMVRVMYDVAPAPGGDISLDQVCEQFERDVLKPHNT